MDEDFEGQSMLKLVEAYNGSKDGFQDLGDDELISALESVVKEYDNLQMQGLDLSSKESLKEHTLNIRVIKAATAVTKRFKNPDKIELNDERFEYLDRAANLVLKTSRLCEVFGKGNIDRAQRYKKDISKDDFHFLTHAASQRFWVCLYQIRKTTIHQILKPTNHTNILFQESINLLNLVLSLSNEHKSDDYLADKYHIYISKATYIMKFLEYCGGADILNMYTRISDGLIYKDRMMKQMPKLLDEVKGLKKNIEFANKLIEESISDLSASFNILAVLTKDTSRFKELLTSENILLFRENTLHEVVSKISMWTYCSLFLVDPKILRTPVGVKTQVDKILSTMLINLVRFQIYVTLIPGIVSAPNITMELIDRTSRMYGLSVSVIAYSLTDPRLFYVRNILINQVREFMISVLQIHKAQYPGEISDINAILRNYSGCARILDLDLIRLDTIKFD